VAAKKPVYMERIAGSLKVFPGAADLVRRRASLGIVGIVSGALEHEIRFCLEQMGVLGEIAFIVAAEHTRACKPDPEGYHLGKEELLQRVGSSDAVVIEDSLAGIQAAKAANLRCVAVAHSYAAEQLAQAGADAVGPDLASLTDEVLDGRAR
jgi:beta-phosphoglucomutase